MGTIRKIGDDYYIEFIARGLRYQRNGGKDKNAAEQLLKDIEEQIQKGEMSIAVNDIDGSQFFENVMGLLRSEHSTRSTSHYARVIKQFKEYCQDVLTANFKMSHVTPSIIEGYRTHLVKSTDGDAKAINFTLILLKDILDYAISLGYLNDNPTLHTKLVDVPNQKIPYTFTDEDVQKVLMELSDHNRGIVQFMLGTAIRFDELIVLKWANVDFKNRSIKIESTQKRNVPMDNATMDLLKNFENKSEYVFIGPDGQCFTNEQLLEGVKHVSSQLKMDSSVFFETLRHTFAKNVLAKGVSLIGLNKLMGLGDVEHVMMYEGFM